MDGHLDDNAVKTIKTIKAGHCPNIFLYGNDRAYLEKQSIRMAEIMETRRVVEFQGIWRQFTIFMPYFDSKERAARFMDHLEESISIARDCYYCYKGLIRLELDPQWGIQGPNEFFSCFPEFIENNESSIKWVILLLQKEKSKAVDRVFAQLVLHGAFLKFQYNEKDPQHWIRDFKKAASDKGYALSEEAERYLREKYLKNGSRPRTGENIAERIVRQVALDKSCRDSRCRKIEISDIRMYLPCKTEQQGSRIGFCSRAEESEQ